MTAIEKLPTSAPIGGAPTAPATLPQSDAILSDLLDLMRRHTKKSGDNWNAQTTLEDIGVDSFDLVELIFEVEDKYDISIKFNANTTTETLTTAGDIVALVQREIAKKGEKE